VAAGDGGVAIFDTLDPFYSRQVGVIDTPGEATKLVAGNEYLYIADDRAGLLVMDVRDPQRPREVARHAMQVRDLWLYEQTLWLVTDAGLSGWTLTENGDLREGSKLSGRFNRVRARDGLLVTSSPAGRVRLWQTGEQGLKPLGEYQSSDIISDLQLAGDKLYLLGLDGGLSTVDIRQPQHPRLSAVYPATGRHHNFVVARDAAFFAGETRMASVKLLPGLAVAEKNGAKNTHERVVRIPADLPRGRYHMLAVSPDGQRQLFPNALRIQFAAPGKKNATLDAFRQLLKAPLKPPVDPETELPASP
jgi:hypothetical protein